MSAPQATTAVALAEKIARNAHARQVDKAGKPYTEHLERVVAILLHMWPDSTDDEICAAWLHDVIEDTEWDADLLRQAGVSPVTISIVQEVTKPAGLTSYQAWIQSMAALASQSALRVKIADNEDNSNPARVASIPEGEAMLANRYRPARVQLEKGLVRGY